MPATAACNRNRCRGQAGELGGELGAGGWVGRSCRVPGLAAINIYPTSPSTPGHCKASNKQQVGRRSPSAQLPPATIDHLSLCRPQQRMGSRRIDCMCIQSGSGGHVHWLRLRCPFILPIAPSYDFGACWLALRSRALSCALSGCCGPQRWPALASVPPSFYWPCSSHRIPRGQSRGPWQCCWHHSITREASALLTGREAGPLEREEQRRPSSSSRVSGARRP